MKTLNIKNHKIFLKFNREILFTTMVLIYFLSARLSLTLATINGNSSPFWPPTGISICFLYFFGKKNWFSIFVGAFLANLSVGSSLPTVFPIAIGNTLEAIIGVYLIHFIINKNYFNIYSRSFAIIICSFTASIVSSSIGILSLCLNHVIDWNEALKVLQTWWIGDAIGSLIFSPIIIFKDNEEKLELKNNFKIIFLILLSLLFSKFVFSSSKGDLFLFILFPFLLFSSYFLKNIGNIISTITISLVAVYFVKNGNGIFHNNSTNTNLLNLQIFLIILSISSLFLIDFKNFASLKKPGLVLISGWIMTGLVFAAYHFSIHQKSKLHFDELVESALDNLNAQMEKNSLLLKSGAAFFHSHKNLNSMVWKNYIDQLDLKNKYNSIKGIGFVFSVPQNQKDYFLRKQSKENNIYFKPHSLGAESTFNNEASFFVTYFEPYENNSSAIGLDISTETKRRSAAIESRESGDFSISSPIVLIQDNKKRFGFLMFYPLYKNDKTPTTKEERIKNHLGWINAAVITQDFFEKALEKEKFKELSFEVIDQKTNENTFSKLDVNETSSLVPVVKKINFVNQSLLVSFRPSKFFREEEDSVALLIGLLCSLITLTLGALVVSLEVVNINAKKIAEKMTQSLFKSNKQLIEAQEIAKVGSWEYNLLTKEQRWTSEHYKIFEIEEPQASNILYKLYRERIHPEDQSKLDEYTERALKYGEGFVFNHRLVFENGNRIKYVQGIGKVIKDLNGKPIFLSGTCQDITTLQKTQEENKFILDILGLGVWKFLPKTQELHWDQSLYQLYEMDPNQFSGHYQAWESSLTPEAKDKAIKELELALKGEKEFDSTFQIKTKTGKKKYIGGKAKVIYNDQNEPIAMYGINWDRSKEVELEESLQSERSKSIHNAKLASLGEMSAGIAHEINNPLAIIAGNIPLLKKFKDHPEKFDSKCESIIKSTERISKIVRGLKKFSRSSDHSEHTLISIKNIVEEVIVITEAKSKRFSTPIELNLVNDFEIFCDEVEIEQVLVNLINNGIDAVKDNVEKWLKINVFSESQSLVIQVIDSGLGISKEIEQKLFQPFFTTKAVGEGTGLGLSITKGILDQHQATISLNRHFKNTCFEIKFPKSSEMKNAV